MGLFDQLLKEGAETLKDLASDENKEKAQELFGALKETIGEHAEGFKKVVDEYKDEIKEMKKEAESSSYDDSMYEEVDDGKDCRQRILEVLESEFPNYTVRQNVSPAEFGGTGRFMDYSIVVCDGNKPQLIIMVISKTTTAHREYRWTREEAKKQGITLINFVDHFPNNPKYISARLHKYL